MYSYAYYSLQLLENTCTSAVLLPNTGRGCGTQHAISWLCTVSSHKTQARDYIIKHNLYCKCTVSMCKLKWTWRITQVHLTCKSYCMQLYNWGSLGLAPPRAVNQLHCLYVRIYIYLHSTSIKLIIMWTSLMFWNTVVRLIVLSPNLTPQPGDIWVFSVLCQQSHDINHVI